jgi:hypothetical protein
MGRSIAHNGLFCYIVIAYSMAHEQFFFFFPRRACSEVRACAALAPARANRDRRLH